jgi:hypothetical protein
VDTSSTSSVQWFARADRTLASSPAALEVGVEVSGTHAKSGAGTRELFSENTLTTLVFEDGVVVRLTAAVEDGQLLFLKHLATQKEIVTRVLRQRSLGAASPYVELEFTEAAPGFWGTDLDVARCEALTSSATEAVAEAREFLASEKPEHESQAAAAMPDDEEVALLREEIAALRSQMGELLEAGTAARPVAAAPPAVAAADMGSVITTLLGAPPSEAKAGEVKENLGDGEAAVTERSFEPLPGNRVTMPWRLVAAIVALAFLSGIASQKGLLSEWFGKGRGTVAAAGAVDASRGNSRAPVRPATATAKTAGAASGATSGAAIGAAGATKTSESDAALSESASATNGRDSGTSTASLREVAARELAALMPKRNSASNAKNDHPATNSNEVDTNAAPAPDVAQDVYEAPSLVKSVNAVPPPDAVRGFVTGDVKFDALIDAKGKVASAEVISGPTALRSAALDALKGYQYKPATKNGQAVSAHVTVAVKFWYEP